MESDAGSDASSFDPGAELEGDDHWAWLGLRDSIRAYAESSRRRDPDQPWEVHQRAALQANREHFPGHICDLFLEVIAAGEGAQRKRETRNNAHSDDGMPYAEELQDLFL